MSASAHQKFLKPPRYQGSALSQAELQERNEALEKTHRAALAQVEGLVHGQKAVSKSLNSGISRMQAQGRELDDLQRQAAEEGLVAALARAFSRRSRVLARRSLSESLVGVHEQAVVDLRRASAVADRLKRCAAELQQEVEQLATDVRTSSENMKLAAERVLALEKEMDTVVEDAGIGGADREQLLDTLSYQERVVSADLDLFRAHAEICRQQLEPARKLRDTVLTMHEEMARFVVGASASVNGAGRKVQALGMAADAATVVMELQESLRHLDEAVSQTAHHLTQADDLLTRVLPDLNAQLDARQSVRSLSFEADLEHISRERARMLADRALRVAAEAEVDSLSGDPEPGETVTKAL
jgi:hypothetical protein